MVVPSGHVLSGMCRNITVLRGLEPAATSEEIYAAALQYVRKVTGVGSLSATTRGPIERAGRGRADHRAVAGGDAGARVPPQTVPPLRRPEVRARLGLDYSLPDGGGGSDGRRRQGVVFALMIAGMLLALTELERVTSGAAAVRTRARHVACQRPRTWSAFAGLSSAWSLSSCWRWFHRSRQPIAVVLFVTAAAAVVFEVFV